MCAKGDLPFYLKFSVFPPFAIDTSDSTGFTLADFSCLPNGLCYLLKAFLAGN